MKRWEKIEDRQAVHDEIVAARRRGERWADTCERLDIGRATYYSILRDPSGEQERARRSQYFGECGDCGKPTTWQTDGPATYCVPCTARRRMFWTREVIIEAIQTFAEKYGRPPSATDWIPSMCRSRPGHEWRANRFYEDGTWPYAKTVLDRFGTWNAAIRAAGFTPHPVGTYERIPGSRRGAHLEAERQAA